MDEYNVKTRTQFFFHFENTLREIGPENIRPVSTQWYLAVVCCSNWLTDVYDSFINDFMSLLVPSPMLTE